MEEIDIIKKRLVEAEELLKKQQILLEQQSNMLKTLTEIDSICLRSNPIVINGKNNFLESESHRKIVGLNAGNIVTVNELDQVELWDSGSKRLIKNYGKTSYFQKVQKDVLEILINQCNTTDKNLCLKAISMLQKLKIIGNRDIESRLLKIFNLEHKALEDEEEDFLNEDKVLQEAAARALLALKANYPSVNQFWVGELQDIVSGKGLRNEDYSSHIIFGVIEKLSIDNICKVENALSKIIVDQKSLINNRTVAARSYFRVIKDAHFIIPLALKLAEDKEFDITFRAEAFNTLSGLITIRENDFKEILSVFERIFKEIFTSRKMPADEMCKTLSKIATATNSINVILYRLEFYTRDFESNKELVLGIITTIGNFNVNTPEIEKCLLSLLQNEYDEIRIEVIKAIEKLKFNDVRFTTNLLEILKDKNISDDLSNAVISALVKHNHSPVVINNLSENLLNENETLSTRTVEAFSYFKVINSKIATLRLINKLQDKDHYIREKAAEALGKSNNIKLAGEIVSALIKALQDKKQEVRVKAVQALIKLNNKIFENEMLQDLFKILSDKDQNVRSYVLELLQNIELINFASDLGENLLLILNNNDELLSSRYNAAKLLIKLKIDAPEIIKFYVELLDNCNYINSAINQLYELDLSDEDRASIQHKLIEGLKSRIPSLNVASRLGIERFKFNRTDIEQRLLKELDDNKKRRCAVTALGSLIEISPKTLLTLINALDNPILFKSTKESINQIRIRSSEVKLIKNDLLRNLESSNTCISAYSARFLIQLEECHRKVVECLSRKFSSETDPVLRAEIIKTLAVSDELPFHAAEILLEALNDTELDVRQSAVHIFKRMDIKNSQFENIVKYIIDSLKQNKYAHDEMLPDIGDVFTNIFENISKVEEMLQSNCYLCEKESVSLEKKSPESKAALIVKFGALANKTYIGSKAQLDDSKNNDEDIKEDSNNKQRKNTNKTATPTRKAKQRNDMS